MNSEVPPEEGGVVTALSHAYWKKTFVHIANDDKNPMAASVAEMALVMLEASKSDPKVVKYLNERATKALENRK
jgi:hypothetical protein